ncbi:hypothetical protein J6590_009049 [Homalodisca vitripennis]|nr:hypothetical protein J6590_009049 [Homalodisca vitripennis]
MCDDAHFPKRANNPAKWLPNHEFSCLERKQRSRESCSGILREYGAGIGQSCTLNRMIISSYHIDSGRGPDCFERLEDLQGLIGQERPQGGYPTPAFSRSCLGCGRDYNACGSKRSLMRYCTTLKLIVNHILVHSTFFSFFVVLPAAF